MPTTDQSQVLKQSNRTRIVACQSLGAVVTISAGYNHVDTKELAKRGQLLANTPDVLTDSVAEIGVILVLECLRGRKSLNTSIAMHWP